MKLRSEDWGKGCSSGTALGIVINIASKFYTLWLWLPL